MDIDLGRVRDVIVDNVIGYIDDDFQLSLIDMSKGININASKDIIQNGETVRITGFCNNGSSLDIYRDATKLTTIDLINGVGEYTYTGSGIGKHKFRAKSGSLWSRPYVVLDTVFYDDGYTDTTQWVNGSSTMTVTQKGLKIEASALSTNYPNKKNTDTNAFDWSGKLCVEFKLVDTTDEASQFQVYDGSNLIYGNFDSTWKGTVKFIIDGNKIYPYVNDIPQEPWTGDTLNGNYRVGFRLHEGYNMIFNNFKIYPI